MQAVKGSISNRTFWRLFNYTAYAAELLCIGLYLPCMPSLGWYWIITLWNGQGLFLPVFVCFMKAGKFQRGASPAPVLVLWLVNQFNISSVPTVKRLASAAVSEFCKLEFTKMEWVSKSLYAVVPACSSCSWEVKNVSIALWVWLPASRSQSRSQGSSAPTVPTGKILISGGQGELPLQAVFLPNAAQNTMLAIFLLISYWSE